MELFETEKIEFKSQFTEDLYKEVIAFANTDGGDIYIGIDQEGNAIGIENVDEEYTRITNGIRDAILPDLMMFVRFTIQDNKVVHISVNEGTEKPYYLKAKEIKPSGVYVRQGTSTVQASFSQIKEMIKTSDGEIFEEAISREQDLTFDKLKRVFQECNIDFSKEKYDVLGITKKTAFTNLALLVSDQCPYAIKIGVYDNTACTNFQNSKTITGDIFTQFEEATNFLDLANKTKSKINGYFRKDQKDYPEEAIREALINALVHRDYSYHDDIIINVTEDRMEILSRGSIVNNLTLEDIKSGYSSLRNRNLANIFLRLKLIEGYGTGIRRIYQAYENCSAQPQIILTPNVFKVILPNMNKAKKNDEEDQSTSTIQMKMIFKDIEENGSTTDEKIGQLLGIKKTRSFVIAKQMREKNLIDVVGRGNEKKYILKKDSSKSSY